MSTTKEDMKEAIELLQDAQKVLQECEDYFEELAGKIDPEDCPCITETFETAKKLDLIPEDSSLKIWMEHFHQYACHISPEKLFDYPVDRATELVIWDAVFTTCNKNTLDITEQLNFIEKYFPNATGDFWAANKEVLEKRIQYDLLLSIDMLKEIER